MKIVVLKMLFIVSVSAQFGKHVYVEEEKDWKSAQSYCRDKHTDLSAITTPLEKERLKNALAGKVKGTIWIGLYKNATGWRWSGGGRATDIPWSDGHPKQGEDHGSICGDNCNWSGWKSHPSHGHSFLCFNLIVVEEKKTWVEALEHCRGNHTDLTSLASGTENLLALSEIQQHNHITERVWIGLRYLGDHWLWVDGDPLVYQAWPQGGDQDHLCPIWKRCGALTKEGQWENRDCQEKLNFICY